MGPFSLHISFNITKTLPLTRLDLLGRHCHDHLQMLTSALPYSKLFIKVLVTLAFVTASGESFLFYLLFSLNCCFPSDALTLLIDPGSLQGHRLFISIPCTECLQQARHHAR